MPCILSAMRSRRSTSAGVARASRLTSTPTRIILNLTAYGVSPRPDLAERTSAGPGKVGLTVTLINKEHGTAGRPARVALAAGAFPRGSVLYLTAPAGDAAATSGIQLGGASIGDDASWPESWKELPAPDEAGHFTIDLPAATAAVVRLFGSGAP